LIFLFLFEFKTLEGEIDIFYMASIIDVSKQSVGIKSNFKNHKSKLKNHLSKIIKS